MIRARSAATLALIVCGCRPTETLTLPEAPEAELAFVILYDSADRPSVIGDVVRRQTIYTGDYELLASGGDLRPRLYFVGVDDLITTTDERCASLESSADRVACRQATVACRETPTDCLRAINRGDSCGERIVLPTPPQVVGFESAPDGRLLPYSGEATLPIGATLCGPITDPPCPNLVAGFIATVDDSFECIVDVEQRGCRLTMDLSRCAVPTIAADIQADGTLVQTAGDCSLASTDGSTTVTCGDLVYQLGLQDRIIGDVNCSRHGPAIFNTRVPTTGRITGGLVYDPPGWEPRDLFVGRGTDDCAMAGCDFRGGSCNMACLDSCSRLFEITECALDDWAVCTALNQTEDCLRRCRSWCSRPDAATCRVDAIGDSITIGPYATPELEVARVDIDEGNNVGASGIQSVVRFADDRLAVVTSNTLHLVEPSDVDQLAVTGTVALSVVSAGVLAGGDDVVVFGEGIARYERRAGQAVLVATSSTTGELARADVGAIGGARGAFVFLAQRGQRTVVVVDVTSLGVESTIDAGGAIIAMMGTPDGLVIAAVDGPEGGALVVLDQVSVRTRAALWNGLRPSALAFDPLSCPMAGAECSIYVGLERTTRADAAHLGLFMLNTTDVSASTIANALVPTTTQQIDLLLVDEVRQRVLAVTSHRNEMSPVQLTR